MRRFLAIACMLFSALLAEHGAAQIGGFNVYLPLIEALPGSDIAPTFAPTTTSVPGATSTPTNIAATATATLTNTPAATPEPTRDPAQCAAEYPTVCIPPPPPDLDCKDIPYRNFTVLPPDRHHFDRDGNGIGCESP